MSGEPVKIGDELAIDWGQRESIWSIAKVDRVMPSGRFVVIDSDGSAVEFNADMTERGHRSRCAVPVTDEIRESIERRRLLSKLAGVNWQSRSIEVLRAVAAAAFQG